MTEETVEDVQAKDVYEVFTFESSEDEKKGLITHCGSVRAPSRELAVHLAREIYYRRDTCERLGVVRRDQLFWSEAPEAELTERNHEMDYRTPGFFNLRRRRHASPGGAMRIGDG